MEKFLQIQCGEIPAGHSVMYLQQHRSSLGNPYIKFMFWSKDKHTMTDMFTQAIWKITVKSKGANE